MWSGSEGINSLLDGYYVMDQNSVPDLRNRFVVGAGTGSIYSVGDTGGSNDANSGITVVTVEDGNG